MHDYLTVHFYNRVENATFKLQDQRPVFTRTSRASEIEVPLTAEQIRLTEPFIQDVWTRENTSGLTEAVDDYEMRVAKSDLPEDQKWELFTIGETVRVTAEFINKGGLSLIGDAVEDAVDKSGSKGARLNPGDDCIRAKDILQGAVLSGFVGAAVGGFYGATVGTFTVPVVGTATGAVGGAVFGFAEGFIGAVIGGTAQQVIFNCLPELARGRVIVYNGKPMYVDKVHLPKNIKMTPL